MRDECESLRRRFQICAPKLWEERKIDRFEKPRIACCITRKYSSRKFECAREFLFACERCVCFGAPLIECNRKRLACSLVCRGIRDQRQEMIRGARCVRSVSTNERGGKGNCKPRSDARISDCAIELFDLLRFEGDFCAFACQAKCTERSKERRCFRIGTRRGDDGGRYARANRCGKRRERGRAVGIRRFDRAGEECSDWLLDQRGVARRHAIGCAGCGATQLARAAICGRAGSDAIECEVVSERVRFRQARGAVRCDRCDFIL